ncbi:Adenosylcobinamide-GDP ribazoletransferase [subsurface metagenome]
MINLLIALQFLTRAPGKKYSKDEKRLGKSMAYFPIVGLILGGILVLVNWGFSILLAPLVADALTIIALIILTGALHIDGFIDTIDGLSGGKSREEILKIMKDSRVGAFGIVGIVSLIMLKLVLLHEMPLEIKRGAILLFPVMGRWAMVVASSLSVYARKRGTGKAFVNYCGRKELVVASLITLMIAGGFLKILGLELFFFILALILLLMRFISKRINGMTGDTLGAINEIIEVGSLFILFLLFNLYRGIL